MRFCRPGSLLRVPIPGKNILRPSTVTAVCKDGSGQPYVITVAHAFIDVPKTTTVDYCIRQFNPDANEQRLPLGPFVGERGPNPDIDIAAVETQPDYTRVRPHGVNVAPRLFAWSCLPKLFASSAPRPVMAWFPSGRRQDPTWGRLHLGEHNSRRLVYIDVHDHRLLSGDSGSPVYIWHKGVLWLVGMIQMAHDRGAGMVRYTVLDIHLGLAALHHHAKLTLQL